MESIEQRISAVLQKLVGAEVDIAQPFTEAGLDSLGAVELRTQLGAEFEIDLPATMAFDYPTIRALAQYIASSLPSNIRSSQVSSKLHTTRV